MERDADGAADGLAHLPDDVVVLIPAVEQGRRVAVETALLGEIGGGAKPFLVADQAALIFAENDLADEAFQVVAVLVNDIEPDLSCVRLQGFLAPQALGVRMDVVAVEKTGQRHTFRAQRGHWKNAAGPAADVQEHLHWRSPKMAVPILSRVAPSAMAASKSPVMPMESSSMPTLGTALSRIRSRSSRSSAKNGRARSGSLK